VLCCPEFRRLDALARERLQSVVVIVPRARRRRRKVGSDARAGARGRAGDKGHSHRAGRWGGSSVIFRYPRIVHNGYYYRQKVSSPNSQPSTWICIPRGQRSCFSGYTLENTSGSDRCAVRQRRDDGCALAVFPQVGANAACPAQEGRSKLEVSGWR
jgi:hypothetical protein